MKKVIGIVLTCILALALLGCQQGNGAGVESGNGGGGETSTHVAVTGITDKVTSVLVNVETALVGTVTPANATNNAIVWSTTTANATITDDKLTSTVAQDVEITATIASGTAVGTDYTEVYTIRVEYGIGAIGPGGGVIYKYNDATGEGMEVSERIGGASRVYTWYQATGTPDDYGNTNNINAVESYTGEGFTDWRLPSKEELNEVYLALIGEQASPIIDETHYLWSSSEGEGHGLTAWSQNFEIGNSNIGVQRDGTKMMTCGVRAIRSFDLIP